MASSQSTGPTFDMFGNRLEKTESQELDWRVGVGMSQPVPHFSVPHPHELVSPTAVQ